MACAHMPQELSQQLDEIFRRDGRKVFATLVRLLGRFDLAEEALQDAFIAAAEKWPSEGIPANPVAWLVSTGRFRAIDAIRRGKRMVAWNDAAEIVENLADETPSADEQEPIEDDRLRLIFTCAHPSLSEDARIALTLREVCGLSTEEVARAFLVPTATLAQRIVRAKAKIHDARIPYEVPPIERLAERLSSVLRVVYLIYNEGYFATSGDDPIRLDLVNEAARLAKLLLALLPEPEVRGLLALILLQNARSAARVSSEGELVPLEDQDRGRWDQEAIKEGSALVIQALQSRRFGAYTLQAAIAAVHDEAPSYHETDWTQIIGLYDALLRFEPTAVVALNRAVAVGMRDGPAVGLALVETLLHDKQLSNYHLAYAAQADMHRRLGDVQHAREAYVKAIELTHQEPERRFLRRRLNQLGH